MVRIGLGLQYGKDRVRVVIGLGLKYGYDRVRVTAWSG